MSKVLKGYLTSDPPVFLEGWLNFFAVVAVLFTTVFGWWFPNTWSIVLLLLCRLFYGKPLSNLKTAFSNRLFLVYFVFFLIEAAGFLHTHDMVSQGKMVTKEASIIVIVFAFCAGRFGDAKTYNRLFTAYSLTLVAACLLCLIQAWARYQVSKSYYDIFYHALSAPLSQNAAFFSVYVLYGIIFLLSAYGDPAFGLPPRSTKILRYSMLVLFLGMMVMLSSRLMLVITPLILFNIVYRRFHSLKRKLAWLGLGVFIVVAVCLIGPAKKFLSWRFEEIKEGNLSVVHQEKFDPATHFSSWDSRLLQWRYAVEILNAHHAWVFGVSSGDSQHLLDQKYIDADMYIGDVSQGPNRRDKGYLGFNFHDQFVETMVRMGLVGLASLVTVFVFLYMEARRRGSREAWFVMLILTIFFIPEAPLTMQHGVFLFCFFPLLAVYMPQKKSSRLPNS